MARTFSPSEQRGLTAEQQAYLERHPGMISLQPHMLASEALYQSRHGAVTVDRAMELDELHARFHQAVAQQSVRGQQPPDNYSAAEDTFIDRNGMSSGLW